jgi:hypothetical protein
LRVRSPSVVFSSVCPIIPYYARKPASNPYFGGFSQNNTDGVANRDRLL